VKAFSKEQFRALLEAAKAQRERDWLMILMAYAHGLRASEVIAITPDDIQDGMLRVKRLKGSLCTDQPLFKHADPLFDEATAVRRFVKGRAGNQPLFKLTRQRFWQIVQQHGATAGLPKRLCHPHTAKHTLGVQLIEKLPINEVQQYMGHSNMNSTAQYLKTNDARASAAAQRVLGD
jgi:integrase